MLKVEYTATPEMLEAMARAEYETRPFGHIRRCLGMVLGFILSLVACLSLWRFTHAQFTSDATPEIIRLLLCLFLIQLLVGIVLLFHKPLSIRWRRHELRSQHGKTFEYTITEEGIGGPALGTTLILPWSFFKISRIKNQGILLRRKGLCYWLPESAIPEELVNRHF